MKVLLPSAATLRALVSESVSHVAMHNQAIRFTAAAILGTFGCTHELAAPHVQTGAADSKGDAVIVGGVNWQESVSLPAGSAERANASAVAHLDIPAEGVRCTGFLITNDVLMTNEHCLPAATSAQGARAYFRYEQGAPNDPGVVCDTLLGRDAELDFALLSCVGSPGDRYGVVELDAGRAQAGAPIYMIHQNCDYYTDPSCDPTKKYSPGAITAMRSDIGHDADTLGGSSGSPLFSRTTHRVIGLHHVGSGNDGNGRGSENGAVPMSSIVPVLRERYPGLLLGPRAPTDNGPQAVDDGYEPNNTLAGAFLVNAPFASTGAVLDAGDDDFFRFAGGGQRTIELTFSHATGDLDLYLYDSSGQATGHSNGTADTERIEGTFPDALVIVRVVGYQGAQGAYTLTVL